MNDADLRKRGGTPKIIKSTGHVVIAFLNQLVEFQIFFVRRFGWILNFCPGVSEDSVAQPFQRNLVQFAENLPITFWNLARHHSFFTFTSSAPFMR